MWLIWIWRWTLFRLMFGAGLIKLRGDSCWRDFTCLDYYFETQPMPNALSCRQLVGTFYGPVPFDGK